MIVSTITKYLSEGILENNAYVDSSTNFLNAIGGPNDGSTTIGVRVDENGVYKLTFQYIIYDQIRPLKLTINGIENKNIYYIPLIKDDKGCNIETFTIVINLNFGNNIIKFHGDGFNYGPSLGKVFINSISNGKIAIFSIANTYKVSNGALRNGAFLDKINNVVTNMGGLQDGYSLINIPVQVYGDYLLKLNYINNNNGILKIDINGIEFHIIYNSMINKTGIFSTIIPLVVGNNKLKFHGDKINKCPDLGEFSVELIKNKVSSDFRGKVFNKAKILPQGIITDLGGSEDGLYILKYDAQYWGKYALYVTLDASYRSVLVVNINKQSKSLVYEIESTDSVVVKVIPVFLVKCINNIIFHGDYTNKAPNILKIELKLMEIIKDTLCNLVEENSSTDNKLDENNNFRDNLDLIDNDSEEININIINSDLYDLNVKYGEDNNKTPYKGNITIMHTKLSNKESCKINYIKLENRAKRYDGSDFISSIGGIGGGRVHILINTNALGWYNLRFKYMCAVNGSILKVNVNKIQVQCYRFSSTKDLRSIHAQIFCISVLLIEGINMITLEGERDKFSPLIGKFNLKVNSKISALEYDVGEGTLKNSARINMYGLVTNIGGYKKGEVSVKVRILERAIYQLNLECFPIENKSFIEIFINGIVYPIEFDKVIISRSLENIPLLSTRVLLEKGENIINFRGNKSTSNYAGFLGKFSLIKDNRHYLSTKKLPHNSYDMTKGELVNGAFILEDFVTNLGEALKGAVFLTVTMDYNYLYSMLIEYRSYERSFLMIDVNGISDGKIYVFSSTSHCDFINVKEVMLRLNKGKNIIKFYGFRFKAAPSLSVVSLRRV